MAAELLKKKHSCCERRSTALNSGKLIWAMEKYAFPANIEFEYPVPEGSDLMTEMSKCLNYCKKTLA